MSIAHAVNHGLNNIRQFFEALAAAHRPSAGTPDFDGGWDASISGPEPHPEFDRTMLDLATAAYSRETHVGEWTRLGDGELAQAGVDPNLQYAHGMEAGIYSDGQGHYVVAFAGNDGSPQDVPTVLAQSAGLDTHQYRLAADLGAQVEQAFGGDNVAFTGHSLGGGLAGIAAAATGSTSVVFNAQGVHDNTLARIGFDPGATRAAMSERGRAYGLDGDYATRVQNESLILNFLPDALGADLRISNPDGGGLDNFVVAHYPQSIAQALDQGAQVRSGDNDPQVLEGPAEDTFNFLTRILRHLPIRI